MSYTVIGSPISPFVRKVMVFLREKGVAYETENVNPFSPPEGFREVSPLGKIPALRHDGRVVNDSSIICRYLERLHPEPAFYPADPYECARAEWIEEYFDGGAQPDIGPKVFMPLVLRPLITGQEPDETEPRRAIAEDLPPYFDYLDSQIGDSGYFVGESLTIADLSCGALLVNLRLAGVKIEGARWPRLNAHTKRMHGRESFRAVVDPVVAAIGKRWVELD